MLKASIREKTTGPTRAIGPASGTHPVATRTNYLHVQCNTAVIYSLSTWKDVIYMTACTR